MKKKIKKHTTKHPPKKSVKRETYNRAYENWTKEEDELLKQEFKKGKTVKELAKQFHRNPGAISSRLYKLGIWY
jgi:DNA-binding NarL/FixJ family response regulator